MSHSNSPERSSISKENEIKTLFSAKAGKPSNLERLQVPGLLKPQLLSQLIAEHRRHQEFEPQLESSLNSKPVRVFILGLSESGKSTLIKSIQNKQGYWTDDERRQYRSVIFKNILDSMISVLIAMDKIQSENEDADFEARGFENHRRVILETDSWLGDVVLPSEFVSAVKALWNHSSIHRSLERRSEFYLMDCAEL